MKKRNRFMSTVLVLVMMLALVITALPPVTVLAATDEVPFVDVTEDTPYYDAIVYCYKHGIFNGTPENTFDPDDSMMRSTVVTVFANLAGADTKEAQYQTTRFDDVALGKWYAPYIEWAAQNEVVRGYGNGSFGPDDTITVEQAIQILYNYAKAEPVDADMIGGFADGASVASWHVDAMNWALSCGIYAGEDGNLNPQANALRMLMAELMRNFSGYLQTRDITADVAYYDSTGGGVNTISDVYLGGAMFAPDSTAYQHDIAKFALAMACAANHADGEDGAALIRAAYGQFGFEDAQYYYYDKPLTAEDDTAAHSFAQKKILVDGEEYLLVVVIGRGSGYGAEWVSNGNVGADGPHTGFAAAAADMYSHLQSYFTDTASAYDASHIKLLLTGFSRAAAVANALAAQLNADDVYLDANIYAYTFATPNVTDAADTASNIVNIINPHDLVPAIPMETLGFDRNGCDILLPYALNLTDDAAYTAFDAYFTALTEQREGADYLTNYDFEGQYRAVGLLADIISDTVKTRENFYLEYQSTVQDMLRDSFGGTGSGGEIDLSAFLVGMIDPNGTYSSMLGSMSTEAMIDFYLTYKGVDASLREDAKTFLANGGAYVEAAHRQEMYIAWMYTLAQDDMITLAAK